MRRTSSGPSSITTSRSGTWPRCWHARDRLADFKVPQYVAVRDTPLPRNPGGKRLKGRAAQGDRLGPAAALTDMAILVRSGDSHHGGDRSGPVGRDVEQPVCALNYWSWHD